VANVFTEKVGPLPVWGWMGIVTGGVLLFAAIRGKSSSKNNTADQQQLAAEEAALANAAQQSSTAAGAGANTYGSGYGNYAGNGGLGSNAGSLSVTPAASTISPDSTISPTLTSAGSSSPAPAPSAPTAPAPVSASATPISNLQAYSVTSSSAVVRWNPDTNSKGYAWGLSIPGKSGNVKSGNIPHGGAPSVALTGLKSKTTYNFAVQGLPGGAGNNIHFTTA
jgi:fibronectin type III domain protein